MGWRFSFLIVMISWSCIWFRSCLLLLLFDVTKKFIFSIFICKLPYIDFIFREFRRPGLKSISRWSCCYSSSWWDASLVRHRTYRLSLINLVIGCLIIWWIMMILILRMMMIVITLFVAMLASSPWWQSSTSKFCTLFIMPLNRIVLTISSIWHKMLHMLLHVLLLWPCTILSINYELSLSRRTINCLLLLLKLLWLQLLPLCST